MLEVDVWQVLAGALLPHWLQVHLEELPDFWKAPHYL